MMRSIVTCVAIGVVGATGAWAANGAAGAWPAATVDLLGRVPGLRVNGASGRVLQLYGKPMLEARTPEDAAAQWIALDGAAFGVPGLDLRPERLDPLMNNRFTCFAYEQYMDGIPVEFGTARILVLNGQASNKVVYAAGKLAMPPEGGFAPLMVGQDQAVLLISSRGEYKELEQWTTPKLVAFYGEGDRAQWMPAVRCWKFMGWNTDMSNHQAWTFFVDASTGKLVERRDEVYHIDVSGTVQGKGTPGLGPDGVGVAPVNLPMHLIRVNLAGGANVYSAPDGSFTISNAGTAPVTVTASVSQGEFCRVAPFSSQPISALASVTPPGPANLVLNNNMPTEATTAQVNGFVTVTKTHEYFRTRATSYSLLDVALLTNVNLNQTCNAFFTGAGGGSVNFFHAGDGCVNTAYSTVVSHEYGHFIVNSRGLAQGAFGEGYGDTNAVMIWDTHELGQQFQMGQPVRDVLTAHKQYPCLGEIHDCGQILAGMWWDTRVNFGDAFGSDPGLEMARQLEVSWTLVTVGADQTDPIVGPQSAGPGTAIEVLTVDDDDGDLSNGSPHYGVICPAFANHNIACPPAHLVDFTYPGGLPSFITTGRPTVIGVNVAAAGATPRPATGQLLYRTTPSGTFTVANMTQGSPNHYTATIPGEPCLTTVQYYFRVALTGGGFATDPPVIPPLGTPYSTAAASSTSVSFNDNCEALNGWTLSSPGDFATTGLWRLGNPAGGTAAQPPADHTPGTGVRCYLTGEGSNLGNAAANGQTTLTTPALNLAGAADAVIAYWRWYSNDLGFNPGTNTLNVDISGDDGATWLPVEAVGPDGDDTHGGWIYHEFRVRSIVPPTALMHVRFVVTNINGAIVDAAVDDVHVTVLSCMGGGGCVADTDGDGHVTIMDFLHYLQLYGAANPQADINGDGAITVTDFLGFLMAYAAGC